ncbi:elongation factor P [Ureaplasma sp. ES3154-GEN]|uniref:elongation factor P n=1 Tax=Ureaplasma sp. ES3154-GEN TaxID=2984844 RepID=UPI0021E8D94E|nr:elongation factor P [Ureaplasma sp. ES3154-GEN]MCV3743497.1 elongation factor P [Ureaplasma sp. ES3154-GEN]
MANIIHAKDLRAGHTFFLKDNIYQVIENSFNKTAMREGIVKCKVKNLRSGAITVEVLTGLKVEQALVEKVKMTFSYDDGSNYVFMNNETFDQFAIPYQQLEWEKNFIEEGTEVMIMRYEDELLGASLPDQIVVTISEAEEAVQGNSVSNATKRAWLASGYDFQVPQFIKSGEKVLINTATGQYVSRAKQE